MKAKIDFTTFEQAANALEVKIGTIIEVERIPKNKKMILLKVDFSESNEPDIKNVVTNIGGVIEDVSILKGMEFPFVTNLEPAMRNGVMSEAMILVDEMENNIIKFHLKQGYNIL